MKKILNYLLLSALFVLTLACSKDDESPDQALKDLIIQQDNQISAYLSENSIEAEKDEYGVYWVPLQENPTGTEINEGDVADVTYKLTLLDGTLIGENTGDSMRVAFDKSASYIPISFYHGLLHMKEGEKFRFFLPFNAAYRNYQLDGVVPYQSIVVMDLEVKEVYKTAAAIKEADIRMIERVIALEGKDADTLGTSGIRKLKQREGEGELPASGDVVSVRYTGSFLDGTVFDTNTGANDNPFKVTIGAGGTIPGFQTALKSMKAGEKSTFYLPSSEAYGKGSIFVAPQAVRDDISTDPGFVRTYGSGVSIPPHSPLVFEIEMLTIEKSQ